MSLTAAEKAQIMQEFQVAQNDSGSPEVQIALLTHRIKGLTEHFKQHDHDYNSRRGLIRIVSQRRKLLGYLKRKDIKRYLQLIKKLGLRS